MTVNENFQTGEEGRGGPNPTKLNWKRGYILLYGTSFTNFLHAKKEEQHRDFYLFFTGKACLIFHRHTLVCWS
jgi:hypothetical protein